MPRLQFDLALDAAAVAIAAAIPAADVRRNEVLPEAIPAGGTVRIHDGEPVERDETIGVRHYSFVHGAEIEAAVADADDAERTRRVSELAEAVIAAIMADPTLGGLVDRADPQPPSMQHDSEAAGGGAQAIASIPLLLEYQGANPAG